MKKLVIGVPNMQSAHCQTRVNNAVKKIEGAQIENVNAGKLTVSFASDNVKEKIVKAIENAGYIVDENTL